MLPGRVSNCTGTVFIKFRKTEKCPVDNRYLIMSIVRLNGFVVLNCRAIELSSMPLELQNVWLLWRVVRKFMLMT